MAILKISEIRKMNLSDRNKKLEELRFELARSGVTANRATAKTKEIKKAIARIITINKSDKEEPKK